MVMRGPPAPRDYGQFFLTGSMFRAGCDGPELTTRVEFYRFEVRSSRSAEPCLRDATAVQDGEHRFYADACRNHQPHAHQSGIVHPLNRVTKIDILEQRSQMLWITDLSRLEPLVTDARESALTACITDRRKV
jgi:hypothetical protein